MEEQLALTGDSAYNAHFGESISSLGDLDDDGFPGELARQVQLSAPVTARSLHLTSSQSAAHPDAHVCPGERMVLRAELGVLWLALLWKPCLLSSAFSDATGSAGGLVPPSPSYSGSSVSDAEGCCSLSGEAAGDILLLTFCRLSK